MNTFKATIAHHQNVIARLGFLRNLRDESINIIIHLRWL